MYKMIYMGSYNKKLCNVFDNMKYIEIIGFLPDPTLALDSYKLLANFWKSKDIPELEFVEEVIKKADFILVNGFSKIIKSELLIKYLFINIHAGNLPKWRGMSANSWALLNGDNKIAYSIHRVTDVLDGGPIYYKYEYTLSMSEQYGDGRKKLEDMLTDNFEDVLLDILEGRNKGNIQSGKYVYCNSFKKKDGYIDNWNVSSSEIVNLFRVFGYPYGSGLYFKFKEEIYEILDIKEDENYAVSKLVSGAVVYKNGQQIWIKTRDTAVIIKEIRRMNGENIKAVNLLNIGVRL